MVCPMCQKTLIHRKHVQNHSDKIHGVCTVQKTNEEEGLTWYNTGVNLS